MSHVFLLELFPNILLMEDKVKKYAFLDVRKRLVSMLKKPYFVKH